MNAPALLTMPHPVHRARLSASDGVPLGEWGSDDSAASDAEAIDLWLIDLDANASPCVDAAARSEARGVAARCRLRQVLARALDRDENEIELQTGARGKPVLCAPRTPPLYFNASRSGPLGLIAVALTEIGVDIERCVHRNLRQETIGHDAEDVDPAERLLLWTRREAMAKATGIGLGLRLRSPLRSGEGWVQFGGTLWGWRDIMLPADTQAIATIAYREGLPAIWRGGVSAEIASPAARKPL